jgi:hypothetical protein
MASELFFGLPKARSLTFLPDLRWFRWSPRMSANFAVSGDEWQKEKSLAS